jgi:hypothetical protein
MLTAYLSRCAGFIGPPIFLYIAIMEKGPFILVGGLDHEFYFSIYWEILGRIIPTDFHIVQRGRSTTNQINNLRGFCSEHGDFLWPS